MDLLRRNYSQSYKSKINIIDILINRNSSRSDLVLEKKNGIGIKRFLGHVSPECIDLINRMLIYDPDERYTAKQALNHQYFTDLAEMETKMPKRSLNHFKQNSLLMMSINRNDSLSFIKA